MQVQTQIPSSTLPYCLHRAPVSLRPMNNSPPCKQACSFTRPHHNCTVQPLSFVSFTLPHSSTFSYLPLLNFSLSTPSEESVRVGGRTKSPAVGNCRVYDALEAFPSWRPASKKAGLFKRAKLKLHPPLCKLPFFLTRPQSTLTPDCTSTPSIETELDSVCQDEDQLRLLSICVLGYMPPLTCNRSYS